MVDYCPGWGTWHLVGRISPSKIIKFKPWSHEFFPIFTTWVGKHLKWRRKLVLPQNGVLWHFKSAVEAPRPPGKQKGHQRKGLLVGWTTHLENMPVKMGSANRGENKKDFKQQPRLLFFDISFAKKTVHRTFVCNGNMMKNLRLLYLHVCKLFWYFFFFVCIHLVSFLNPCFWISEFWISRCTSWWFQPIWKIWVKLDHFPR